MGGQPVVESDRINDDTAPQVATGNKGDQVRSSCVKYFAPQLSIVCMMDLRTS